MSENTTRFRRRTLLVNRRTQFRFIGLLLVQMSIILTALGILVNSHMARVSEIAAGVPFVDARARLALEGELIESVHGFYQRSLGLIASTAVLIVLFGLLASHKLAGPLVKLQRHLNALADGDYSQRIAFRRTDHLDPFAQSINRMAESFGDRRSRCADLASRLLLASERCEQAAARDRALAEMEGLVSELRGVV